MYTRAFKIIDEIISAGIGTVYADIYNDEETARAAGYCRTNYKDQYGYMVWKNNDPGREYYKQEYAVVLPIC